MNQKGIMKELSWIVGIVYLFFAGFYFFKLKFLSFIPYESHIFIALLSFVGAIYALAKWIDELTEYSLWGPFAIFGTLDIILAIVLVIQALLNIGAKYVDFLIKYVPQGTFIYYVIFAIAGVDFLLGPILRLQY